MAVISFSSKAEGIWSVAGWAFRQLLDDVAAQHPTDKEMTAKFDEARTAYSALIVEELEAKLADRITTALNDTVTGILSGTIRSSILDQSYGNKETFEQYQNALRQLLQIMSR